ncbi:ABC transporter ATP-binding protein [Algivirga pacifica]|uniref:ABC transporter ATP-binding protein n=1 Tax=Algivirga pacifica TaxID=1162670 RepID=A0ABP9D9I6_9BACT
MLKELRKEDHRKPLLYIKNLTVEHASREGFPVIDNLTLTINEGETLGIVGESGSGKSVTALSILQLIESAALKITEGEILFNSNTLGKVNLLSLSAQQIREIRGKEIGMIFQEPLSSLNPVLTCGDQVMEAVMTKGNYTKTQARRKVLALFQKVQLHDSKKIFLSYPHELSGGQKQRVMIAMAIACTPQLLIADEPTTALDVTVQKSILELIQELNHSSMATFFISHDLSVIAEVADKIAVMFKGKVVEYGSVWEVFENPKHPYTKGLLACRPRLDTSFKRLPVVSDFVTTFSGRSIGGKGRYSSVKEAIMWNKKTDQEIQRRNHSITQQTPILSVHNLSTYYPTKTNWLGKPLEWMKAVEDVSFEVYPGETLGLVGESGCGKTTLGRTILQLVKPIAGQIMFKGRDISSLSSKELIQLRKDIQIIFQNPYASLNPRMTVGEAIMEPMKVHGIYSSEYERKKEAIQLLERVNLNAAHFNRYPHEFSGGQRQRICIARTLAVKPKFIICDESVSALDVSVQATVLNLLNELKEEYKLTYIFISHDLSVVKFMADRMLIMKDGEIVEQGFAQDIYTAPQHPYTQKLIESIPTGNLQDIQNAMVKKLITKQNPTPEKHL